MNPDQEIIVDHTQSELSPMNSREHGLLVTYDFLKHMSTLSIVAVGGMLGLAQGVGAKLSGPILKSIVLVGATAFLSLTFMAAAAATQISQRVHKTSKWIALGMVVIVLMTFSSGIGAFIAGFRRALGE
jgi:hypothetical protein